ncbi:MAG: rhamnulokinase [Defluviitaleaceae bacterium]|nr:rhamnulokinase [Defluviitaleaceae bacterium]
MYYLAIDIGASGGRHILGRLTDGKLALEEVHRFKNGMTTQNGHLCWDTDALFTDILTGLENCKKAGKIPTSVGIDTWGVDFVLLDESGGRLGDAVAYRDSRTQGMEAALSALISDEELYSRTGIQQLPFNTIYQLMALQAQNPALLARAKAFLLMPEYFSYLLTGAMGHEYTNATTTGLISAHTNHWDRDLIGRAGLPLGLFDGDILPPGWALGHFSSHIQDAVGFNCQVVYPCTHDTGSAVVASPIDEGSIFLSSGTWSLIGAETTAPICTEASRQANFSNEGGYGGTYRYLKNIMGLWMIQCIKAELQDAYSFDDMRQAAEAIGAFPSVIDVNDRRFLAPERMIDAIQSACKETGQPVPETVGELALCVYQSLAHSYALAVQELEALTGRRFSKICIVGGGSQNAYLNQLTARACKRPVSAGPTEGTAAGNILVQMIADGQVANVAEARRIVRRSFPIKEYS